MQQNQSACVYIVEQASCLQLKVKGEKLKVEWWIIGIIDVRAAVLKALQDKYSVL